MNQPTNPLPQKYHNQILNTDTLTTLQQLPDNCLHCIYGDPDYNVGIRYNHKNHTTPWNQYIQWYTNLAAQCLRTLRPDGNLYLINYPKQNAYLRVQYLDHHAHAVHDYVWIYNTNVGHTPRRLTTAHRSILHATKTKHNNFYKNQIAQPYQNPTDPRIRQRIAQGHKGRMPYSWLYHNLVKNVSTQKTNHPCQIPQTLSQLLLKSCTQPGHTAFILFGGSGSEVIQAKNLQLTYLTCELQPHYCQTIQTRLQNNGNIPPHLRHPAAQRQKTNQPTNQTQLPNH